MPSGSSASSTKPFENSSVLLDPVKRTPTAAPAASTIRGRGSLATGERKRSVTCSQSWYAVGCCCIGGSMYRRAGAALVATILSLTSAHVATQGLSQPTAAPVVTAEAESWYVDREPIIFAGNLYYPAGAQVFFNPNEMVRSGFYFGVPLYTRTTIEPYSLVYVPVAGGRMQAY